VQADEEAVAARGAALVVERARDAVAARGAFHLALSGGRTPWRMLGALAGLAMPWRETHVYQVDERVAPDGDPDRNLTHLLAALEPAGAADRVVPMPVTGELDDGAAAYERLLPARLDLVHLGLGDDGHTASLVPGDPVLDEERRLVAVTGVYRGHRRMTLTFPALRAAREALWLITGRDKRAALAALMRGDASVPAARVATPLQVVVVDDDAAGGETRPGPTP
jgi:6-phosphogluconolactonase